MNQLKEDLSIKIENLNEDIARQPGLFAYYHEQLRQAEEAYKHAKLRAEIYEAALDRQVRDQALARSEKITETIVEKRIRAVPGWADHQKEIITAEAAMNQLKGVVEAMRQKKDMLVTVAANARAEMHQGFAIKGQRNADETFPLCDTEGKYQL